MYLWRVSNGVYDPKSSGKCAIYILSELGWLEFPQGKPFQSGYKNRVWPECRMARNVRLASSVSNEAPQLVPFDWPLIHHCLEWSAGICSVGEGGVGAV
ncbi:hypothetical protein An04g04660 [Aspergillus niger]|uniref:Uncharacterized protein n=2 Tax=Aspergillus niger TaxID=5061 RepID=A2QIT6_ASPNC|nr:hypothetical protein An04g04660 [Aspergillus niger]CAK38730.1 hypothetical protein An04g04660 [Aspergillus niger]